MCCIEIGRKGIALFLLLAGFVAISAVRRMTTIREELRPGKIFREAKS